MTMGLDERSAEPSLARAIPLVITMAEFMAWHSELNNAFMHFK
jgi:hypothetical protein